MRITSILPIIENKLFRVVYDNNEENILKLLYEQWTDTLWLREFSIRYQDDLKKIEEPIKNKEAVKRTIEDADQLFKTLYESDGENLATFFRPLHNKEEPDLRDNQQQKGRIERPRTWLRIYAVHYDSKYIVTGGAIKLTQKMNRAHLKEQLSKLDLLTKKLELDIKNGTLGYLEL